MTWVCSLVLVGSGCGVSALPHAERTGIRYLALGDSYTIGQGVGVEDRWPLLLAEALEVSGCGRVEATIVARSGWTASELTEQIQRQSIAGPFDLVTVQIGVNDQYRGRAPGDFRPDLARLMEEARQLSGGRSERIILVSVPDWSATPFGGRSASQDIPRQIDGYNQIVEANAAAYGFGYVYVTDLTRAAEQQPGSMAGDGLHYSGTMHTAWVERILPVACAALGAPGD